MKLLKYIGDAGTRILSKLDLAGLGADAETVLSNIEGDALAFSKNVVVEINTHVAEFIAGHEDLAHEFHLLSDDEAAAEVAAASETNPPAEPSPSYMVNQPTATPSSIEPASDSSTDQSAPATTAPSSLGSEPEAMA